jgi:hypothetical protein
MEGVGTGMGAACGGVRTAEPLMRTLASGVTGNVGGTLMRMRTDECSRGSQLFDAVAPGPFSAPSSDQLCKAHFAAQLQLADIMVLFCSVCM